MKRMVMIVRLIIEHEYTNACDPSSPVAGRFEKCISLASQCVCLAQVSTQEKMEYMTGGVDKSNKVGGKATIEQSLDGRWMGRDQGSHKGPPRLGMLCKMKCRDMTNLPSKARRAAEI